ncbi:MULTISPECIES: cation:proton antiporter [Turicibacter]|uniref:Toxin PIN n=2 Tax=Turicibacter sanguinis TaxID=154288 RepID=A0A173TAI4_9FIRM|nr:MULTISPECIES: cation:proton antiporter [Turicibacter]MEE0426600.1 cation:proton antiporter [Turicibacter sp.]EFF64509.1 toxin-antitoxin system toxin component, PIN family [Turicibacter sanguinis PC909]EGC91793.1 putative toxin-antitoxin system toxin component, PIN family [Turicibacter sp. HGF1]MCU7190929.1 cation:proton antiporter [Turicibacter sanguinis]MCU7202952.1 cation:proton antiporter [Turicibacter sanguinis]
MIILIVLLSLIIIGILANYSGKLVEYIKLPSLIGMMIFGMIIGPAFLNVVPQATLKIAPVIKDIALVAVLFIGGLGISLAQMKQIGRPAILLSAVPATLEGFTIALMSMLLLKFSFVQGAILGFIIAAVSPAVLIPSMIDLINRRVGQDKAIPQMLLVGASADDTIAITLFTTFLGIYFNTGSISTQLLMIPVTLVLSIGVGYLVFKLTRGIIEHVSNDYLKVMIAFGLCLAMRAVEKYGHVEIFNSLLTVMVFGFFIRNYIVDSSKIILDKMNLIWKTGKLYLFAFVGMAINPTLVGEFFLIGVGILSCSLFVRSIGVLISLIGTNLSLKERIFCVIAYLPKATVQSAKAAIPMQMGVVGGEIMQAIAILSVLITAPIGAIGIKLTSDKLLKTEN